MDCDIYIPDVFVSRMHCRFILRDGYWYVLDAESRNGIWVQGRRVEFYLLKPGDLIEIGTIAFRFNAGDTEERPHPAPLGLGPGVTDLMDTVYAHDLRPSEYAKAQKARKLEYVERMKRRMAERSDEDIIVAPVVDAEPWKREEWAELDVELQLAAGQEQMADWEAPIFNPAKGLRAQVAAAATGTAVVATPAPGREMDSIDEEVEERVTELRKSRPAVAAPAVEEEYTGITFEEYTWRDRVMDAVKERLRSVRAFSKVNPQLAAGIAIGMVALLYLAVKFAPVPSGPHLYVPPPDEVAQSE